MTSTLIKTNNHSSKMRQLTGLESVGVKVVSILFLVIINITGLSSQNSVPTTKNNILVIKPTVSYNKKTTPITHQRMRTIYNLKLVRNFPTLEGVSKQELQNEEVHESFDYDLIFGAVSKQKESSKITSVTSLSTSKI